MLIVVRDGGDGSERRIPLVNGMRIGRSPDNEILVRDENAGRYHSKFVEDGGAWFVEDLGSTNATVVVGGPQLKKGSRHPLGQGTEIRIGRSVILVEDETSTRRIPAAKSGDSVTLAAEDVRTMVQKPAQATPSARPAAAAAAAVDPNKTVVPAAKKPAVPEPAAAVDPNKTVAPTAKKPAISDESSTIVPTPPNLPSGSDGMKTLATPPKRAPTAPPPPPSAKPNPPPRNPESVAVPVEPPRSERSVPVPAQAPKRDDPALQIDKPIGSETIIPDDASLGGAAANALLSTHKPRIVLCGEIDRRIVAIDKSPFTIGRDQCDLVLAHPSVSARHAEIRAVPASRGFTIVDRGNRNTTIVDGAPLPYAIPRAIEPHSYLRIGPIDALFVSDFDSENERLDPSVFEAAAEALIESGKLTTEKRDAARSTAKSRGATLGEILVLEGAVEPRAWAHKLRDAARNRPDGGSGGGKSKKKTLAIIGVVLLVAIALVVYLMKR